jgi:uncharacterized protein
VTIVIDTSAILALYDEDQAGHAEVGNLVTATTESLAVSPMVVAEADYMLSTRLGPDGALAFARDVAAGAFDLADWGVADHGAALAVVGRFVAGKDHIGITDAGNVVLADRYRTNRLLTLDQRHFRLLRPISGPDHFALLPFDT